MNKKFKNTVITGLQMFMTLSLSGRPAQDSVAATAKVWCELLAPLRQWDDEDLLALQRAFTDAARQATQWPAPRDVINCLDPKIKVSKALPAPKVTDAEKRFIDRKISRLLVALKVQPVNTRLPENTNIARITHDNE